MSAARIIQLNSRKQGHHLFSFAACLQSIQVLVSIALIACALAGAIALRCRLHGRLTLLRQERYCSAVLVLTTTLMVFISASFEYSPFLDGLTDPAPHIQVDAL